MIRSQRLILRVSSVLVVTALLLMVMSRLAPGSVAQEVPELQITSTNYILVDADTGEIYAQRGARERRAPASLTKIFTAIETIEEAPDSATITTSDSDLVSEWASQVGFSPGETFTVEELLYGMMLPSGNDAARALARGLGAEEGDSDEQALNRFLDRLNQRFRDMGLNDTHLVNPDGWGVPGHYSSPYDLAAFTMYALHYPRFVRTFSTGTYEMSDGRYTFKNNNRMLQSYDGIIGGKTGYDDDAGWCLVNVAERDGSRFIAVTMNGVAPDDWYDDNRVLLNYGFEQKALRTSSDPAPNAEFVRYRDPDAAHILTMATSSVSITDVLAAPAPPQTSQAENASVSTSTSETAAVETNDPPTLVPEAGYATGAGSGPLLAAAAVAVTLIVVQGFATWRLRSPAPTQTPAGKADLMFSARPARD